MSFSYQFGANPAIDYPRFLVADTVDTNHIFEDAEIVMATTIQSLTWQSSQFYSGTSGSNLPAAPVSYRRVAATLLDAIAANKSRLASVSRILNVELNSGRAADSLRASAQCLRDEDSQGAFVVIEQVTNEWSFRDRFLNEFARQST